MTLFEQKTFYKYHLLIALVIGVWLALFLILIAPFDIAELPIQARLEIMPIYGLIAFFGYVVLIPVQIFASKKIDVRSIRFEIAFLLMFNILVLIGSLAYYNSGLVNGNYSFLKFSLEVYMPVFFILLPIIIMSRQFLYKKVGNQKPDTIVLKGDNQLDILQLRMTDLICISSADNYISVTHLVNGKANQKLLRATLKSMELKFPELLKVHRSHLINPAHFKEWKNGNTVVLTETEVPVSKNYKKSVLAIDHSSLNTNDSPQDQ